MMLCDRSSKSGVFGAASAVGRQPLIMETLPFALTGGIWLLYLLGFNQSVATGVGFIALAVFPPSLVW
jgi:Cu/Ag efflux pump CusA